MIVLGIDPGSHRCGYGVVAREGTRLRTVESGVIEPGDLPLAERLSIILCGLEEVIARTRPAEAAVEQVHTGPSPRSALVLGQARGVALAAAARGGLSVFEYQPSEVKLSFTGSGRASKEQMIRTARQLLGIDANLSDEADALAIAVCHLARRIARIATDPKRAAATLSRLRPARREHRSCP
ncbi:MAG: crossover junction endodeoxyribonuclease RuvC [Anaeromyxobacteraceae bacterium]